MSGLKLPARSIWSPHRDSGCVQVCKSLLTMRGEDWLWVQQPEEARWLVIDASRRVEPEWSQLLTEPGVQRFGIALAKSWSELPNASWRFFKLPLLPRDFFPWINQAFGLPSMAHVSRALPDEPPLGTVWTGKLLRLRRWPNLCLYPDPAMRLPELCQQLLTEPLPFETLQAQLQDDATLMRLLDDANRQHILLATSPDVAPRAPAPVERPTTSANEGSLLQRFLSRFR